VSGPPAAGARKRVAVLASGRGSNLQSLLDACADPAFPAQIALVIVNVPEAQALDRARRAGVPALLIDHRIFPSRVAFETAIDLALRAAGIELVCLAGFMRRLTPSFTLAWAGKLINIHPSLLPAFPGLHTHRRALETGTSSHGCSVHFVTAELDAGPVIAQAAVPVLPGDDEDRLAARVLVAEHALYPAALRLVAEGRVRMEGDRMTAAD
jgi:phosphoribosylglycinamide formyltransferase-1